MAKAEIGFPWKVMGMLVRVLCRLGFLAVCAMLGCQGAAPVVAPPDASMARTALEKALTAWKAGQSAASVNQEPSPIVVRDPDWVMGARLLEFTIAPDVQEYGNARNFHVQLKTQSQGRTFAAQVTYIVAAGPPLTILRE